MRVPETPVLSEGTIEKPVKFEPATKHFVVPVGRKTNNVQLLVKTEKARTDHWAGLGLASGSGLGLGLG